VPVQFLVAALAQRTQIVDLVTPAMAFRANVVDCHVADGQITGTDGAMSAPSVPQRLSRAPQPSGSFDTECQKVCVLLLPGVLPRLFGG